MHIVLCAINAKYIHTNLAVHSIRAYAAKRGVRLDILEFTINDTFENIYARLLTEHADVLAFSCYVWNIEFVKEIIREYGKVSPETEIWVGGPEVSYETERFLEENPTVYAAVIGEGEETFCQVARYYDRQMLLDDIDGIMYRRPDGSFVRTGMRKPLDMDELVFPYADLAPFENKIIYYESSRGCPFECTYCMSSIDGNPRFRSLKYVFAELDYFLRNRVKQVKFVDRTFNCNRKYSYAIWSFIKEHDNGVTNFHFEIAADILNDEEIELLSSMRPGLVRLEVGVQTTNFEVIRETHRTMSVGRLEDAVQRLRKAGNVELHLDLIAGLPYENAVSFEKSFNEIYALKPHELQLGFLKVLKGTYMYANREEYSLTFRDRAPYEVLETRWMSAGDILRLKLLCRVLDMYYNSGQFKRTLEILENSFESPYDMYMRLAAQLGEHDMLGRSLSRREKYDVIFELASGVDPENVQRYKEALTADWTEREPIRRHPCWAI